MNDAVFVANRSEIAVRIARTVHSLGRQVFGVYTPDDAHSPHRWAMDACRALPDASGYTQAKALIACASDFGARYVHPGYGFLSQDPAFAQAVARAGLVWIGPSPAAMRALGDKGSARLRAQRLKIPVIVGAAGLTTLDEAHAALGTLGFPALLKAPNAGGGRGLVRVDTADSLANAFEQVRRVAGEASPLVLERYVHAARHIEVQVAADGVRAWAVGTRDCSTQRRQQKLIEEAPASAISASLQTRLQRDAQALFADAQYAGVGTVEFLVEADGSYSFLEVNPRLQVEHTVTEELYGVDLVAWQLAIAQGQRMPTDALVPRGHAIEARLVAEDPSESFAPELGELLLTEWPSGPGIRVDAGVAAGSLVGPAYDSLLAKITAWAPTREQARRRLVAALLETTVLGVQTNKAHLLLLLQSEAFVTNALHTRWLEDVAFVAPKAPSAWAQDAAFEEPVPRADAIAPSPLERPRVGFHLSDGFGR